MRKLSISLICVVLASILGLGWLLNKIYNNSQPDFNSSSLEQSLSILSSLSYAVSEHADPNKFVENWNMQGGFQLNYFPEDELPLPRPLEEKLANGETILLESELGIEAYSLLPDQAKILSLSLPSPSEQEKKTRFELLLTLSFYAGITTIVLIWVWPLIHQLQKLRKTAIQFGQGRLSTRTNSHSLSYIKDIESEFNRMADKIESLVEDNKLLSRAVSHDLKTPLARLRFGLDALSETEDTQLRLKYADRVDRDLEDMESLIETLLQYARLDEAKVSLRKSSIDVQALLTNLIDKQTPSHVHITITSELDSPTLSADPRYLSMLFNNIISNAIRHAKEQVLISLALKENQLVVYIEDDGPGIPKSNRSDAIKPFWRGEPSRDQKGHGMGLAIVSRIAAWHKAKLKISQSSQLGGARISLFFEKE